MRGRTSCISLARIRSGRPESTGFLDLIAIPSSTILALGHLALGPRPIDSVFHGGGVPKRRDPVDYREFVSSQGTVFFRMFRLQPASKRHPKTS
jgi:hypothetical protein